MLSTDTVRSITYKEYLNGPNITKAQALAISAKWNMEPIEPKSIDDKPSCDDFTEADADSYTSSSGSSSTASTPKAAGKAAGKRPRRN